MPLTLYDPGGGGFKNPHPPPIFCSHAFNIGAALLCVGDFSQKINHDLAVRGVSKYKVDMIFIIFREFNTMLEILIHSFIIRPKQVNK